MSSLQARLAVHGPNTPFTPLDWWRLGASGARTVKLLQEDTSPAEAAVCKRDLGMTVVLRIKGEGICYTGDVAAAIREYAGLVDVLEIGNEPWPTAAYPTWDALWWNHADYLNSIWRECAAPAHAAGMRLCTPGWQGERVPPLAGVTIAASPGLAAYTFTPDLAARLLAVYGLYDLQAVHVYDAWQLATPAVLARLQSWHDWLPDKGVLLSEVGIAGRWPLGPIYHDAAANSREKVDRYLAFLALLPPYVTAMCIFLLGGSDGFRAFHEAGIYAADGGGSYWLEPAGWAYLGMRVRTP